MLQIPNHVHCIMKNIFLTELSGTAPRYLAAYFHVSYFVQQYNLLTRFKSEFGQIPDFKAKYSFLNLIFFNQNYSNH
jgi:hypothetical protein